MEGHKIIECFGLPGSGKSSCITHVKNHVKLPESVSVYLRKEGDTKFLDNAFNYPNKRIKILSQLFIFLHYLIQRPLLFVSVLKSLVIFRFNRNYFSVLRSLTEALYCYSRINKTGSKNTTMLLDEGLIQYLGALVVSVPESNRLPKRIVNHVLSNYIGGMIYIDVDFDVAINRIKDRNDGKSRFDYMEHENAVVDLKKMQDVFNLCADTAQNLNIPALKLESGGSIDENTNLIMGFLEKQILK